MGWKKDARGRVVVVVVKMKMKVMEYVVLAGSMNGMLAVRDCGNGASSPYFTYCTTLVSTSQRWDGDISLRPPQELEDLRKRRE
jgi:hypothetical protein